MSSPDAAAPDPLVGQLVHGRYRVLRRVGAGSMGFIHEVEHVVIGRRFALKTLQPVFARDPKAIKRFQREARAAALVGHEGIVSVTDMGLLDDATGTPFLVMELLHGATLGEELARFGPLTIERALGIALSCCGALAAAHERGIVHRDIKPDNVFLAQEPGRREQVKIVDFGISRVREALGVTESSTVAGSVIGTPYYMSPEQFEGRTDVDGRADVYALGVVLFQMLTGVVPFRAANVAGLMMQVLKGPAPSLRAVAPAISDELDAIVRRAMATSRDDRVQSMDELAGLLRPVLARYGDDPDDALAAETSSDHAHATIETPESMELAERTLADVDPPILAEANHEPPATPSAEPAPAQAEAIENPPAIEVDPVIEPQPAVTRREPGEHPNARPNARPPASAIGLPEHESRTTGGWMVWTGVALLALAVVGLIAIITSR